MINAAKWVANSWAEELENVLKFLAAEDWKVTTGAELADVPAACYWWTQKFNAAAGASIGIGAPALAWSELGARILQAAGVDLIEQASARSTYLEAVQQSASGLARAITARVARAVETSGGREEAPDSPGVVFSVGVSTGDFELPPLVITVSEELCWALNPPAASAAPLSKSLEAPDLISGQAASRSMSVLLDVQMPVSISFGKSLMPLREIMKLTTGSAVELDRKPDDEVDVIVNNCIIARGEVVVVEGNYGVRITEIVSREQRLALHAGVRAC